MKKLLFILLTVVYFLILLALIVGIVTAISEKEVGLLIFVSILLLILLVSYLFIYKKIYPKTQPVGSTAITKPESGRSLSRPSKNRYQVLATLNKSTCEFCGNMDLATFNDRDYKEGVTAPPFHEGCRCTTVPVFDDFDEPDDSGRIARNPFTGKTYYVRSDMNWREWRESFNLKDSNGIVESSGQVSLDYSHQDLSKEWEYGTGDISLPDAPIDGFVLNNMRYIKYEDASYNRYLLDGRNRDKFVEIVSQVVDAVKRECNLLHEVKYHKMEYEPRIVNLLRHYSWGVSQQITLNNDFCWLQDTRFTRTGKIAKNAYVLNFWDNPVRDFLDYENYQVSFGEVSITSEHKVNKGRLVQRKGNNNLVVAVKEVKGSLVVSYIEENGKNILNT